MLSVEHKLNSMYEPVSVLLPCNRVDSYLETAVNSILTGNLNNLELVIVGDNLSDMDIEAVKHFVKKDKRVKLLISTGSGLVDALNHGLANLQHEFVARMDADDVSEPNRLVLQSRFLKENPKFSAVGSQVAYMCEHGVTRGRSRYPRTVRGNALLKPFGSKVAHPAIMFRKSLVLEVGGYRNRFRHSEDLDLWNRLLNKGNFRNLDSPLLRYRQHSQQISISKRKEQLANSRFAMEVDILESFTVNPENYSNIQSLDTQSLKELLNSETLEYKSLTARMRAKTLFSIESAQVLASDYQLLGGLRKYFSGSVADKKAISELVARFFGRNLFFNSLVLIQHIPRWPSSFQDVQCDACISKTT